MTKEQSMILFDLDGTITDSAPGIINSVCYALEKYGRKVENKAELQCFVGPPLQKQFQEYTGAEDEDGGKLVEYYREYYQPKGIFENRVYEGILETVKTLRELGFQTVIATSKPEIFARQIAKHFDFARYFDFIGGSLLNGGRVKKAEVIEYVLESCGVRDRSKALMVGDREHDILGAKEVGIKAVGVLYGYGDSTELSGAGADYLAEKPEELLKIIRNQWVPSQSLQTSIQAR